jgi:MYXO-CTERM domain-containing protein
MMQHFKNRMALGLAALALLASHAAQALPTYHVSVDARSFTGPALLDFTFLANAGATPTNATVHNFSGAFGATVDASPGVTGASPAGIVLGNQNGGGYLTRLVQLGGWLCFDISFGGAFATTENVDASLFAATLYNADLSGYIGDAGSLVEFSLLPQVNGIPGGISVTASNGLASVTEVSPVPEPSFLSMALGGLGLLGLHRRRHAKVVRTS